MEKKVKENVKLKLNNWGEVCKYNPQTDIAKVQGGLAVDIDDMLQTGVVKDGSENLDSNGIDSPDKIVGRIRDVFDAMDASRVIKKYGRKPAKAQSEVSDIAQNSSNEPR